MPFSNALGIHEDKSSLVAHCQDPPNDSARFCFPKPKLNIKSAVCRKVGMTNFSDKDISLFKIEKIFKQKEIGHKSCVPT